MVAIDAAVGATVSLQDFAKDFESQINLILMGNNESDFVTFNF